MAWVPAADCAAFAGRDVIAVHCNGRRLALYRLEDDVFATTDVCPHQGASLSDGCLVSGYIECPVHFALFDIRTGEPDGSVTTSRAATFATKVEDGMIYVDMPSGEENGQ
jgi:nitrite reductase/ring-hydroxylating ferredoxin subunit